MAGEAIKQPLRGVDVSITVAPVTVNASTGALTAGSATALTGVWDEFSINPTVQSEDFSAADMDGEDHRNVKKGCSLTLTTINQKLTNALVALAATGEYFKILIDCGLGVWEFWGVYGGVTMSQGAGKGTAQVTFNKINTGQPNPLYSEA